MEPIVPESPHKHANQPGFLRKSNGKLCYDNNHDRRSGGITDQTNKKKNRIDGASITCPMRVHDTTRQFPGPALSIKIIAFAWHAFIQMRPVPHTEQLMDAGL
jgi:hypothetical protein